MLQKHIKRIVRFPVTIILLTIFATFFFAYQFKSLSMVLDPKALLPQEHPYVKLNNEIEKQFGGSRVVLIGLASKDGDIFNPSDIEKLRRINEEVKKIPGILENNVVSIADKKVKYVRAEGNTLEIKSMLEGIEYTPEGMKELKNRVYSNPMFVNSLVSADGKVAAIILDFKGGASDWSKKTSQIPHSGTFLSPYDRLGKPRLSEVVGISSAYAEEDWKKWQGGGGTTEKKQDVSPTTSPSPSTGEGQGGGEQGKWPAVAGGGEKSWEQWYVSDSTIHKKILEIVDKYKDANTDIYVGGLPIALAFLEADSLRMTKYVYPLALIVIMIVLYFVFQSIQGMILPIVCALLSVVWAVGLMGVFKIPLDPWNMMTPILILAVAAGHSVQILKRYYEELGNAKVSSEQ